MEYIYVKDGKVDLTPQQLDDLIAKLKLAPPIPSYTICSRGFATCPYINWEPPVIITNDPSKTAPSYPSDRIIYTTDTPISSESFPIITSEEKK